jgi:hypothetical protein
MGINVVSITKKVVKLNGDPISEGVKGTGMVPGTEDVLARNRYGTVTKDIASQSVITTTEKNPSPLQQCLASTGRRELSQCRKGLGRKYGSYGLETIKGSQCLLDVLKLL